MLISRHGWKGRRPFRLAVIAGAVWLAGCAAYLPPSERDISLPGPPAQAERQTPVQREHQRILAVYGGIYENARLHALVAQTVDRLVAASERPDLKYRVTILNSPAINAFALPSGQLYVTRGLLALANDSSELASVLAHEMAHVIADHAAIRQDQARQAAIVSRVVSDVLSDPMTGALALAKSKIALASFSRAQELEADGIGIAIAARAGYDSFGGARFLTAMGRNAELKSSGSGPDPRSLDFMSSHPATPERIKNAQLNARHYTAPGAGERDRAGYLAALDGVVYGEDPADGFVRGRGFIHPRLGFTFMAPEGFSLENTAQAVLGVRQGGSEAMRLDVVRVPAEQSLAAYLVSGWLDNVDPRTVADVTINGFPAATATARGEQWSFRLYAVRFGSDVYRFIYAARDATPAIDRTFRESVETFRRLSLTEIETARPLRLKIITVRPGDAVEAIAHRYMAHLDHATARVRVLNGLGSADYLRAGESLKIVVE